MRIVTKVLMVWTALALPLLAQAGGDARADGAKSDAKAARPKVTLSDAGRSALAGAKDVAGRARGLKGPERAQALEAAATAYDKVVAGFTAEPAVAASAAFAAGDLWRQQGSLPLAEKDYLLAAQLDADRFAQRALLGAADMQRRQKRIDEAMSTYSRAVAVDPGSTHAQDARLWQGRLLQGLERIDEAIVAFQAALESADPGAQTIDACNFLALAWIQKGDLDAASRAIEHAEHAVQTVGDEDPLVVERLGKSIEGMSAKKALQRARDKKSQAGKDAARFDAGGSGSEK